MWLILNIIDTFKTAGNTIKEQVKIWFPRFDVIHNGNKVTFPKDNITLILPD